MCEFHDAIPSVDSRSDQNICLALSLNIFAAGCLATGVQFPAGALFFSLYRLQTGSGAHTASYTIGTEWGCFPEITGSRWYPYGRAQRKDGTLFVGRLGDLCDNATRLGEWRTSPFLHALTDLGLSGIPRLDFLYRRRDNRLRYPKAKIPKMPCCLLTCTSAFAQTP
jgi:hypothetical protein